jgi:hypothetical protein
MSASAMDFSAYARKEASRHPADGNLKPFLFRGHKIQGTFRLLEGPALDGVRADHHHSAM